MAQVVIVDTGVFLNILNVPAFNQHREEVIERLKGYLQQSNTSLLLPMIAIVEAGNHIAQLSSGGDRRRFAEIFVEQVKKAISGEAPWRAMQLPDTNVIEGWLDEFPDRATGNIGVGDLAIIKDWEARCDLHSGHRVTIWSLDLALNGYDRAANI